MKTFFDGIFMNSDDLKEEGKDYPIKLEYYKTIEMEENVEAKYGIEIVKTEYLNGRKNIEIGRVGNLTKDLDEAENILILFRNNEVTPVELEDILSDMFVNTTKLKLAE